MIGILGAGLAGLSLGYFLRGEEIEILEKNSIYGGLLRSVEEDGFTFDCSGGHIIFSKDERILGFIKKLLRGNFLKRRRNTKIYYRGRYIKYPFENGLWELPLRERYECLFSFVENKIRIAKGELQEPRNFREWLYYNYGRGIAERYLIPYNRKIWKHKLEEISCEWVHGRIPSPPIQDVIKSSLGIETEGYTHQLNFIYPARGGIFSLAKALAKPNERKIQLNFHIKKIRKAGNGWIVSGDEDERFYSTIISTIPLPELINLLDAPEKVKDAASMLKYNSLLTIMVGVDGKINEYSWLYFPGREIFHKVSFPSNYSELAAPPGKSSLIAEITYRREDGRIVEKAMRDLEKIIERERICYTKIFRTKYAYIIYDFGYRRNVDIIKKFLSKKGIKICGRFAEWEYLNMDACIKRAKILAHDIK
jgi:protoporphyrinogen oxidase